MDSLIKVIRITSVISIVCSERLYPVNWTDIYYPANMIHRPNVGVMLGQRRRRWANIGTTLGRCLTFAGYIDAMSFYCWANVCNTGPESIRH